MINPFFEPEFYHRATILTMLNHLKSPRPDDKIRLLGTAEAMPPSTLSNIQYILSLTAALRKKPPNYTAYQQQNYVLPRPDSSNMHSDTWEPKFFDINEVFQILTISLATGLAALRLVGIDPSKLPRVNPRYSLLDIEIIRDLIGLNRSDPLQDPHR
jgi:hypothetical protein